MFTKNNTKQIKIGKNQYTFQVNIFYQQRKTQIITTMASECLAKIQQKSPDKNINIQTNYKKVYKQFLYIINK